jgi:hypothetical protein
MTERRKRTLNAIDEAVKQERAAEKLEELKAAAWVRPAPQPITIVGTPARGASIKGILVYEKTPRGVVSS